MLRFTLSLLFAWVLSQAPASAQPMLSHSEFRDAAIALIQAQTPQAQVTARDELGVDIGGGGDEKIATFTAAMAQAERPSALVWRPFAGDLVEVIVFDGAETVQYATVNALQEIGVSPEAAWEAAPRNLPARLGALEVGGVEGADTLVYVAGGNGLATSSLIDGRICAGDGAGFAFLVVDRNGYVMADRADSVAERQVRALLEDLQRDGGSLSLTPLACQDGRLAAVAFTD